MMKRLRLVLTLGFVLFVGGCGAAPELESRVVPTATVPSAVVSGGTAQQRAIVLEALAGLGGTSVSVVRIGAPPPGFVGGENSWLYYTIVPREGDERRAMWEAMIASGAVTDKAHGLGLPDIEGETFSVASAGVPPEQRASARIGTKPGDTHVRSTSTERLDELIREHAERAGVTVEDVVYLRPLTLAPVIRVTAENPDDLAANRRARLGDLQQALASFEEPLVDGVFFEVVDGDGKVLSSGGYSIRTAAGIGN
jgi:hypothetical protein